MNGNFEYKKIMKKQLYQVWSIKQKLNGFYTFTLHGFNKGEGTTRQKNKRAEQYRIRQVLGQNQIYGLFQAKQACRKLNSRRVKR